MKGNSNAIVQPGGSPKGRRTKTLPAIAYHEAGHAVIQWRLGFRVTKVTVVPEDDSLGHCASPHPRYDPDGEDFEIRNAVFRKLEKRIISALAGPEAQRRFDPRSVRSHHGSGDYYYAADAVTRLNSCEEEWNAHLRWLQIIARNMVNASWNVITVIASALLDRKTIKGAVLQELMNDAWWADCKAKGEEWRKQCEGINAVASASSPRSASATAGALGATVD